MLSSFVQDVDIAIGIFCSHCYLCNVWAVILYSLTVLNLKGINIGKTDKCLTCNLGHPGNLRTY